MKRLFSLTLCLCLLCWMVIPASASTQNVRSLEYTYIDTVYANLTIDSFWGIATCVGSIDASGDYPVYVQVSLQQKTDSGWETLQTWTNDGQILAQTSGKYAIARGYQYRTYTIGYVYNDAGVIIDSASAIYAVTYN